MREDLGLRRKWTFRAHGRQVVLVKRTGENSSHVLMKALLWALYLPDYPDLSVEIPVGGRYRPDVVAAGGEGAGAGGEPRFWGEAGEVGLRKIRTLARRYRSTHVALAKWDARLEPFEGLIARQLADVRRGAPFDLIRFPSDSDERFVGPDGAIRVTHADLEWRRFS